MHRRPAIICDFPQFRQLKKNVWRMSTKFSATASKAAMVKAWSMKSIAYRAGRCGEDRHFWEGTPECHRIYNYSLVGVLVI